jgi:hypothetical protein
MIPACASERSLFLFKVYFPVPVDDLNKLSRFGVFAHNFLLFGGGRSKKVCVGDAASARFVIVPPFPSQIPNSQNLQSHKVAPKFSHPRLTATGLCTQRDFVTSPPAIPYANPLFSLYPLQQQIPPSLPESNLTTTQLLINTFRNGSGLRKPNKPYPPLESTSNKVPPLPCFVHIDFLRNIINTTKAFVFHSHHFNHILKANDFVLQKNHG